MNERIQKILSQRGLASRRKAEEWINSGMSATEACYRSGFRSYSSFTRAYGKYYGTTPTGRTDKKLIRGEDYE